MARVRKICFTINNYTDEHVDKCLNMDCVAIVAYKEVGESGTPHIQGAMIVKYGKSFSAFQKMLGGKAHVETMKGSWADSIAYCSKDGEEIRMDDFEEPGSGKRTDLIAMRALIDGGAGEIELWEANFNCMAQYSRAMKEYMDLRLRKKFRTEMTKGTWYHGATGTGKSHTAFAGFDPETHYVVACRDKGWWDGYTGQETVIMNEFRGQISYAEMLDLTDKWPVTVPRRGREPAPFLAKTIIVTSPFLPTGCWPTINEAFDQIDRRFEYVELTQKH